MPYRVVINEAVELAKSYGGTDGHKYVNGVLDKLARARARRQKWTGFIRLTMSDDRICANAVNPDSCTRCYRLGGASGRAAEKTHHDVLLCRRHQRSSRRLRRDRRPQFPAARDDTLAGVVLLRFCRSRLLVSAHDQEKMARSTEKLRGAASGRWRTSDGPVAHALRIRAHPAVLHAPRARRGARRRRRRGAVCGRARHGARGLDRHAGRGPAFLSRCRPARSSATRRSR